MIWNSASSRYSEDRGYGVVRGKPGRRLVSRPSELPASVFLNSGAFWPAFPHQARGHTPRRCQPKAHSYAPRTAITAVQHSVKAASSAHRVTTAVLGGTWPMPSCWPCRPSDYLSERRQPTARKSLSKPGASHLLPNAPHKWRLVPRSPTDTGSNRRFFMMGPEPPRLRVGHQTAWRGMIRGIKLENRKYRSFSSALRLTPLPPKRLKSLCNFTLSSLTHTHAYTRKKGRRARPNEIPNQVARQRAQRRGEG